MTSAIASPRFFSLGCGKIHSRSEMVCSRENDARLGIGSGALWIVLYSAFVSLIAARLNYFASCGGRRSILVVGGDPQAAVLLFRRDANDRPFTGFGLSAKGPKGGFDLRVPSEPLQRTVWRGA